MVSATERTHGSSSPWQEIAARRTLYACAVGLSAMSSPLHAASAVVRAVVHAATPHIPA